MIEFDNGGRVVESASELPNLVGARTVYADFETTSGNPKFTSLNPWHNCEIAGLCVTVDDERKAWYLPLEREDRAGLSCYEIGSWLGDLLARCEKWVNHNIKYDAHVAANCLGVVPKCELVDTLTLAKIIDSDRITRGGYGLKALSRDWLGEDIGRYEEALAPYLVRNKDYGKIPTDLLGEYGCQDVLTNRRLYRYIMGNIPEQCNAIRDVEIKLTHILFKIERRGLRVNPTQLDIKELTVLNELAQIDDELTSLVGRSFRPHVNGDCFEVLCGQYDLPVLGWTDSKPPSPSFNKATLVQYAAHPYAPSRVVELIQNYRHLSTLMSIFIKPYQELHVDGYLHSSYNQAVRTGRMSCKQPNSQQLSPDAKRLVIPPEGYGFISADASQVEFRIIVHYIQDPDCIKAYNDDPDTDFHNWVAEMVGMARKPAKNVNFMMSYGGGKGKCVKMLSANMEVVGQLKKQVDKLIRDGNIDEASSMDTFNLLCGRRAEKIYEKYHKTLPGLKLTARLAESALLGRGYIYNAYGRHRHLPFQVAWKAFSSLCQSTAADLVKERMVALDEMLQGTPIEMIAQVHDDILMQAPREVIEDPRVERDIVDLLEHSSFEFRVPIRWDIGHTYTDWHELEKARQKFPYRSGKAENLRFLS